MTSTASSRKLPNAKKEKSKKFTRRLDLRQTLQEIENNLHVWETLSQTRAEKSRKLTSPVPLDSNLKRKEAESIKNARRLLMTLKDQIDALSK